MVAKQACLRTRAQLWTATGMRHTAFEALQSHACSLTLAQIRGHTAAALTHARRWTPQGRCCRCTHIMQGTTAQNSGSRALGPHTLRLAACESSMLVCLAAGGSCSHSAGTSCLPVSTQHTLTNRSRSCRKGRSRSNRVTKHTYAVWRHERTKCREGGA
jgi:hypothetical protein